jgi:hypothetical protein
MYRGQMPKERLTVLLCGNNVGDGKAYRDRKSSKTKMFQEPDNY